MNQEQETAEKKWLTWAKAASKVDAICLGCKQYQLLYNRTPAAIAIDLGTNLTFDELSAIACCPVMAISMPPALSVLYLDESLRIRHWI